MALFDFFKKKEVPKPELPKDYSSLLKLARNNPQGFDFNALRHAFITNSGRYNPYSRSNRPAFATFDLWESGQTTQAVQAIENCLHEYYLNIDAHLIASMFHSQLGNIPLQMFHRSFGYGLLHALMATGDGKSPESAFVVIDIPEEYTILNELKLTKISHSSRVVNNTRMDILKVNDKNGTTSEIYFNVDFKHKPDLSQPSARAGAPPPSDAGLIMPAKRIGNLEWMMSNLNSNKFRNGELIPGVKSDKEWILAGKEKRPAWCYPDNRSDAGPEHGLLYNYYAVTDPRGLLPEGWRLPAEKDWLDLVNTLGGRTTAGQQLKSTSGWNNNGSGTNQSGFNALPSGGRIFENAESAFAASFTGIGTIANWWSADESGVQAWAYSVIFMGPQVSRMELRKEAGFSVRGVK